MIRTLPLIALTSVTLAIAACATVGAPLTSAQQRGLAFANARCAGCHAVKRDALQSPNPASPTFEQIANRNGLTRETLNTYLRDAHNYPEAMQFTLDPKAIDDLSDYMLTLRRDDYRPPI